jgi:hypothetical protein
MVATWVSTPQYTWACEDSEEGTAWRGVKPEAEAKSRSRVAFG